jgi:hypothetical protein
MTRLTERLYKQSNISRIEVGVVLREQMMEYIILDLFPNSKKTVHFIFDVSEDIATVDKTVEFPFFADLPGNILCHPERKIVIELFKSCTKVEGLDEILEQP